MYSEQYADLAYGFYGMDSARGTHNGRLAFSYTVIGGIFYMIDRIMILRHAAFGGVLACYSCSKRLPLSALQHESHARPPEATMPLKEVQLPAEGKRLRV